jgi:hypothetical protein
MRYLLVRSNRKDVKNNQLTRLEAPIMDRKRNGGLHDKYILPRHHAQEVKYDYFMIRFKSD